MCCFEIVAIAFPLAKMCRDLYYYFLTMVAEKMSMEEAVNVSGQDKSNLIPQLNEKAKALGLQVTRLFLGMIRHNCCYLFFILIQ
jgi:hypothetical protein